MTEVVEPSAFLRLPVELIIQILNCVEAFDVTKVAQVCKQLYHHASDDQVWQPLVNSNIPNPILDPKPLGSFRDLYVAHHPNWFLTRNRIWYADSEPSGKLIVSRYDAKRGCIEAYAVVATRGRPTLDFWERDREVIIHSFHPRVTLDLNQPVVKLDMDSPRTDDQANQTPSDRGYAPPSLYNKEVLMTGTFAQERLYSSFMLCRALPDVAISQGTQVWPPLRIPARARTRNGTLDGYKSAGHRPTTFEEVSQHTFRLRRWVEYAGRRSSANLNPVPSTNGLSAMLGAVGPYFGASRGSQGGGMVIRMPEDIATFAALPESCYRPAAKKPWQGIWCGDYSGHGCEFLLVHQPDEDDATPLPSSMAWLRQWFRGGRRERGILDDEGGYTTGQEEIDFAGAARAQLRGNRSPMNAILNDVLDNPSSSAHDESDKVSPHLSTSGTVDYKDAPTGRLEAIKLTGDPNIPRGEYTFVSPDIGSAGFMRVADEEIFRGARVVRSAGHIARGGFMEEEYTPSELIMISRDRLAQFWLGMGHISYYQRVDIDALLDKASTVQA